MKNIFNPDLKFNTIYEIEHQKLKDMGISFVLCDLDNTIADYGTHLPTEAMREWIAGFEKCGISFCIVSNNGEARTKKFCEGLKIPYFFKSGKPKASAIDNALKLLSGKRETCALIGDKITTDVVCARRAGVLSIKVKSIKPRWHIWKK